MRTDERAGQAAKHKLRELKDRLVRDRHIHPNSIIPPLKLDERLDLQNKIALLEEICGCN